tara:strand:+ start:474 stop:1514 length:1041 start_codon:yes stop_codon:yes gene_type:complete
MDLELLARVESEVMHGVKELSLTVAGEPFLTPRLPQFVELAERTGAELSLNTNGTIVKDTDLVRRILTQASVLRFSVDGATAGTYESIRGASDFSLVMRNIRTVVGIRKELPRDKRPRLVMCMVLMRRNLHELVQMVELAHSLELDRLDIAHLTVLVPEMDQESLRHIPAESDAAFMAAQARADALSFRVNFPPLMDGRRIGPSGVTKARLALQELRHLAPRRLKRLSGTVSRKHQMADWSKKAGGRVPCRFLQDGVFITIQGEVAPCPMPGRPIVGDLNEESFDEIWNGASLTAMRKGFIEGQPFDCCAHCSQNPDGYVPEDPATVQPAEYDIAGLADRPKPHSM